MGSAKGTAPGRPHGIRYAPAATPAPNPTPGAPCPLVHAQDRRGPGPQVEGVRALDGLASATPDGADGGCYGCVSSDTAGTALHRGLPTHERPAEHIKSYVLHVR